MTLRRSTILHLSALAALCFPNIALAADGGPAEKSESGERLPPLDRAKLSEYGKSVHDKILSAAPKLPYKIADENDNLIGMYRVLAYAPAVGEGITELGNRWIHSERLSRRMQEIAILGTSAADRTAYVWYAHQSLAKGLLTDGEMQALRERKPLQFSDPKDQAVHEVTQAMLDKGDVDDALYQRAVSAVGYDGLVELVWIIGIYKIDAMQLRIHRLGSPGGQFPPVAAK